jgi:Flp pilus assembly pilin Flp
MIIKKPNNITKKVLKDQSGQTFVEFVLLLASIVIIAFSFMRLTNSGVEQKWTRMAQIILDDDTQILKAR